ncbi:MAG: GNAT family N-acetyltransferase [bacterium]|nr:GNAT family N-acetyltransferase [bacterium]
MSQIKTVQIRTAEEDDAEKLLTVYAPYVEHTAITFEYEVPSVQEFADRIQRTKKKYPYLVAESGGEILGYAYAGAFHERAAYDWAVETSIYIRQDKKKMGIGKRLYEALEAVLAEQNILNLNACIAYPVQEDEYLTKDSVAFHRHMGYRLVGEFYQCGYKFHRWYNMVWMEKQIGTHKEYQPAVIPFAQIQEHYGRRYHDILCR